MQVIAGGDCWHRLGHWLLEENPKHGSDAPCSYIKKVRLRCYLFTAICRALYRWDPEDASGHAGKFLAHCVRVARDHVDLLPLLIEALEEASRRPSRSRDGFENLLGAAKREAFRREAELQLLRAELCLYHPVSPSPWGFRKLLRGVCADRYHPLRVDPPRQDPLNRFLRMHRWAARCAHLLERQGFPGRAARVLQDAKQVENDGFFGVQALGSRLGQGKEEQGPEESEKMDEEGRV